MAVVADDHDLSVPLSKAMTVRLQPSRMSSFPSTLSSTLSMSSFSFHPSFTHGLFPDMHSIDKKDQVRECFTKERIEVVLDACSLKRINIEATLDHLQQILKKEIFWSEEDTKNATDDFPGNSMGDDQGTTCFFYFKDITKAPKHLAHNLQSLFLCFIDGANRIDILDSRWSLFLLYVREEGSLVSLVGACTCYNFPILFGSEKGKNRVRISQFAIWPPFQCHGYGFDLYCRLMQTLMTWEEVSEITVESPSEQFEMLRLKGDVLLKPRPELLPNEHRKRLYFYDRWSKAISEEDHREVRIAFKKHLIKVRSDIPQIDKEERKSVLQELWEEEKSIYDRVKECKRAPK